MKAKTIGLIVPSMKTTIDQQLLNAVEMELAPTEYILAISITRESQQLESASIQKFRESAKLMDCHQMSRVFSHFPVYAKKTVNAGMAFQILQNERFFFSRIGYAEGNHAEIFGQYGHALFIKSVLKTVYAVRHSAAADRHEG